jgi:hypothetical protein
MLLRDFKRRLSSHGKTLEDYGLDIDRETNLKIDLEMPTELQERMDAIKMDDAQLKLQTLNDEYPNNVEQQIFMDKVEV